MNIFQQAAALVSDPPGSLVYHLVLLFAMGVAAAVALGQWRLAAPASEVRDASRGRLTLAAGLLFMLRLLALGFAFLAALGILDSLVAVPPFERAVSTLTILVAIWFLDFPQRQRLADAAFGLLGILVVLSLAISWGLWSQQAPAGRFYNGSPQETAWEAAQLILLVAGGALLAVRRRSDWLLGLGILALLLVGHVIHYLYTIAQSNVSGTERLFEIVMVPLIAAAIFRRALRPLPAAASAILPAPEPPAKSGTQPPSPVALPTPVSKASLDPRAVVALASLGAASDLTAFAQAVTVGVGHALPAPISLLLSPAEGGFKIDCAYDLPGKHFVGMLLTVLGDRPEIVEALAHDDTALWVLGEKEAELRALAFEAGLQTDGPLLLMPVRLPDGPLLAALGALPGAGQAGWPADQRALLKALAQPVAHAWQAITTRAQQAADFAGLIAEREAAVRQSEDLRRSTQAQTEQVQRLEEAAAAHADELVELEALRAHLQSLGPDIDQSRQRQQGLEAQLAAQRLEAAELRAELDRVRAQPELATRASASVEAASAPAEAAP